LRPHEKAADFSTAEPRVPSPEPRFFRYYFVVMGRLVALGFVVWVCVAAASAVGAVDQSPAAPQAERTAPAAQRAVLDRYCVTCHNTRLNTGNLALDALDLATVGDHQDVWEKVVRKLRGGLMPPAGARRPDQATQDGLVTWLETQLDAAAAARPNPGRTETFHRLNRAEYRNAVRDVLAIDLDVAALLPGDSASYGFDNMAGALKLSESLMERYLSAARKISRAAVGSAPPGVAAETYNVSPALRQDQQVEGLPFGTRGGTLFTHQFPQDADYVFNFNLANTTAGADLDVLLDGQHLKQFNVQRGGRAVDADGNELIEKLEIRVPVTAGPHEIGVAFVKAPSVLAEANRRPFLNPTVSGTGMAALRSVTITGPFDSKGASDTPSRERIFVCHPDSPRSDATLSRRSSSNAPRAEADCARTILSTVARRAYRRPVDDEDLKTLMAAYTQGRAEATFEAGVERGLQQILVSPQFLFRVEIDPPSAKAGSSYRISDLELASRLSFFLWSSVPDDELLDVAARGRLRGDIDRQVRRMLADPRSEALTANFAGQWLQLRNLAAVTPSEVLFPDFDDTLRQAFRRETELFFDSVIREDRRLLDLLDADYSFLNERLARHYGMPGIKGSHFRRVTLADQNRRGLLGQGSILTITSHPVRTSPVFRGKWILDNLLGTPPPDPPANVPPLPEKTGAYAARMPSMRERMAQHRENAVCASCHAMIDPLGFGLERYDPVGRWRDVDENFTPIDASGVLPDGTKFNGVAELRAALARRPERFVSSFTEKLTTYALGRGLEPYDMPALRKIVRDAAATDYKTSSLILGIVKSLPFQNRTAS
jgi:mono/diheme cytochrome c family protein